MNRESLSARHSWTTCRSLPELKEWREAEARKMESRTVHRGRADGLSPSETEGILFALALAVEHRDGHTGGHCERLAFMSVAMGLALKLARPSLITLYQAGYLHDVGKIGVPDAILLKPGKLSAEEWETMRTHPLRGEEICSHIHSLSSVLPVIRHHHERWDGSGYPDGLKGVRIPKLARVLQIADIYDALVSTRPYKASYSPGQALEIIREETACGWRDPGIVEVFLSIHDGVAPIIEEYFSSPAPERSSLRASLGNLQRFLALAQPAVS